jgi:hypothetical protein
MRLAAGKEPGAVPLMAVAIQNAGSMRKGVKAMEVLTAWAIAVQVLGHELGEDEGGGLSAAVREYTGYWKQSERTTWRDMAAWKAAFPGEESPASLARQVLARAQVQRGPKGHAAVAGLLVAG